MIFFCPAPWDAYTGRVDRTKNVQVLDRYPCSAKVHCRQCFVVHPVQSWSLFSDRFQSENFFLASYSDGFVNRLDVMCVMFVICMMCKRNLFARGSQKRLSHTVYNLLASITFIIYCVALKLFPKAHIILLL